VSGVELVNLARSHEKRGSHSKKPKGSASRTSAQHHAFAFHLIPTLEILAASENKPEIARSIAHHTCNPIQPPFPLRIAPAIGSPTSKPNPAMVKDMPSWMPIVDKLGDKLMIVTPGNDTNEPQKNPYSRLNTMVPAVPLIPIHPKQSIDKMNANGICMFSGPVLSAKKFGISRPIVELALIIERRYEARLALTSVRSKAKSWI